MERTIRVTVGLLSFGHINNAHAVLFIFFFSNNFHHIIQKDRMLFIGNVYKLLNGGVNHNFNGISDKMGGTKTKQNENKK